MARGEGAGDRYREALSGHGLVDGFIYRMPSEDYRAVPDPFPRGSFEVQEVQESIERYADPHRPGLLYRWDVHGTLLTPERPALPAVAVVMIHGGAANEYEFLFTPDGPEQYVDLTAADPTSARVGVAQHLASLGFRVLAISLPGHFSRDPWPPVETRRPEFVIGSVPDDEELAARLARYTFRMCVEAVVAIISRTLSEDVFVWGHSTAGELPFLLGQHGLPNRILGGIGYGSGMPADIRRQWEDRYSGRSIEDRISGYRAISGLERRSPAGYERSGYVGPHQPWGDAEAWFRLENHRRPQFKPFLQTIEHNGYRELLPAFSAASQLADEEFLVTERADLTRLRGLRLLHLVGERDRGHWHDGGEDGDLERGREVFGLKRLRAYVDDVRLVVLEDATHYAHIEAFNERLANLMAIGFTHYLLAGPAGHEGSHR